MMVLILLFDVIIMSVSRTFHYYVHIFICRCLCSDLLDAVDAGSW